MRTREEVVYCQILAMAVWAGRRSGYVRIKGMAWVNLVCAILRRKRVTSSHLESLLEVFQGERACLIERRMFRN